MGNDDNNSSDNDKADKLRFDWKAIGMDKLALMVAAGIVLVWCSMPEKNEDKLDGEAEKESLYEYNTDEYERNLEQRLESLLEQIDGVGAVRVMVTISATEEKVVLKEEPYERASLDESDAEGGQRVSKEESRSYNTVYITDENGNTVPYVVNELMPRIEGVAVIAKGGDSSVVKEKIINVVKSLFDVDANKISISKMK